ncbi:MAG: RidA family protein [Planctomycetes bacterium]|nr:RidA family protein [Planctomycetota bacterium]
MDRKVVTSGAPWEQKYGYRRAVRVGPHVHVSGTAPLDEQGNTFGVGDGYAQARRCLAIALDAAAQLGATVVHVVRTRMYVTDMRFADDFGRAHGEVFSEHPPASTMVEVRKLIHPDMLIEIELEAYVP